jgi:hypothetical protein
VHANIGNGGNKGRGKNNAIFFFFFLTCSHKRGREIRTNDPRFIRLVLAD